MVPSRPILYERKMYPKISSCSCEHLLVLGVDSNHSPIRWSVSNKLELVIFFANYPFSDECVTPEGENGECVSLEECPALFDLFANPRKDNQQFLDKFACKMKDTLCCPYSQVATKHEFLRKKEEPLKELNNLEMYCGVQQVDGYFRESNKISIDEYPWLAGIRSISDYDKIERNICGGSLINSRYVLTAAQCVSVEGIEV